MWAIVLIILIQLHVHPVHTLYKSQSHPKFTVSFLIYFYNALTQSIQNKMWLHFSSRQTNGTFYAFLAFRDCHSSWHDGIGTGMQQQLQGWTTCSRKSTHRSDWYQSVFGYKVPTNSDMWRERAASIILPLIIKEKIKKCASLPPSLYSSFHRQQLNLQAVSRFVIILLHGTLHWVSWLYLFSLHTERWKEFILLLCQTVLT